MKKIIFFIINLCYFLPFSFGQITIDGDITEAEWGTALATSGGGPSSGFAGVNEVNAIYFTNENDGNFLIGIAGNIEFGNRILVFLDSKSGGYTDGSFDRTDAPPGIDNFNGGTTFDAGFQPDYCLVIGLDNPFTAYFFDMYKLSTTGVKSFLGDTNNPNFGANPASSDNTRGFEARIPLSAVEYDGSGMQAMVMYISDAGFLSNQFLSVAGSGQGDYGSGAVNFGSEPPNPITISSALLDVDLTEFKGQVVDGNIGLNWTTLTETNNLGFDIEKSINGKDFEIIGRVEGVGNSVEEKGYTFIDENPVPGINYYRLKQIDFDGTFEYSNVISVDYEKNISIDFYPNPVSDHLMISSDLEGEVIVRIVSINGQVISENTQLIDNQFNIDVSVLNNGMYYLQIINQESVILNELFVKE